MTAENMPESVDRVTEIAGRVAAAMIAELKDAEGAWELPDADWTEDLFHRSRIFIEDLLERLRTAEAELATVKQQRSDNLQAIAERDAVIAAAQAVYHGYDPENLNDDEQEVIIALSTAPESVLAARDAEKWDEGFAAGEEEWNYSEAHYSEGNNPYQAGADHE